MSEARTSKPGRGRRTAAAAGWSIDGLSPVRVVRPASAEEMARTLGEAVSSGQAVVPVGGGRSLGMGDALERWDVAIETAGLNRIVEYNSADLTVTAEAGIPLERLSEELGRGGQFLPLDPFASPGHTVGGLLASGWSGPLRLGHRHPRDFLIGLRVALPDGRLVRSGGRVVKNVSGYDLNKLHLSALGALGVIVEASFKVFPKPLHEVTLERRAASTPEIWSEIERALAVKLPPVALELLSPHLESGAAGGGGWRLLARVAGTRLSVERIARELGWEEADAGFWAEHSRRSAGSWARVSVPRGRLPEVTAHLPEGARWWGSPGVGVAHWIGCADPGQLGRVRSACEEAGGSLVLLAAPAEVKRSLGAWGRAPAGLDLMRAIRDAFDPTRAISPGRYVA
ncbi:MAG: FAD-binding oxidoreductase [Candidatus Dormibacteraceae bacterium]